MPDHTWPTTDDAAIVGVGATRSRGSSGSHNLPLAEVARLVVNTDLGAQILAQPTSTPS